VDYLDLYFCHRPDIDTPIEETVRAMHDLIAQGKVLYWGTSEWSAQQLTEAYAVARDLRITPPTMEQPQYNVFERQKIEADYLPLYNLMGLGTTIWSPLASGILTGKYNKDTPNDSRLNLPGYEWLKEKWSSEGGRAQLGQVRQLTGLADEIGLSMTHLALLWCLSNRNVSTVILGASRKSQLVDNLAALDNKDKLTPEVLARIDEIVGNKPAAPQRF
jgi:aryl-alcohol dehydrogenase-like predicted oxidoreductase